MKKKVLYVLLPRSRESALKWVFDFVFNDDTRQLRFDLHDNEQILFHSGDRTVSFESIFPNLAQDRALWQNQMPTEPIEHFPNSIVREFLLPQITDGIPILFGQPSITANETTIHVKTDLFGGVFFLLSRFEELVCSKRDEHSRFPGSASLALRAGFLNKPLADIYRHIIRTLIARMWPAWKTTEEVPKPMTVSCDVDEPFDNSTTSPYRLIRSIGADLLFRHSPSLAAKRALNYALGGTIGPRFDPCYTFEWYMDACEAENLKATFYFIAGHSAGPIDGTYKIYEPRILTLLRKITDRGHSIGMHGSYNSFRDAGQLARERSALNDALKLAGSSFEVTENRQHYLRWDTAGTPENLETAGFESDSTGGFADIPGFRFGTARMFNMWSWQKLHPLNLVQRPLVVMEASLLSDLYLGLNEREAENITLKLQENTNTFGGQFSVLWHNSSLKTQVERKLFRTILAKNSHNSGME